MDPNQEIENPGGIVGDPDSAESDSVDDFIRQLEEKEKDLHLDADTTVIEIDESDDAAELPDFMKGEFEFKPSKPAPAAVTTVEPKAPPASPVDSRLEKEVTGLKEKIAQLHAERDELLKTAERRAKDFANFKSRTERERQETLLTQVGNLATQMLPALDNLDRALDFALAIPEEKRGEMQQFFDGMVLINQQVNEVLAEMGLQPIATIGETFDPHLHEAVATESSTEFAPNTVSAELRRGYRIGDRVIRHSMVKVAKAADMPVNGPSGMTDETPLVETTADADETPVASPPPTEADLFFRDLADDEIDLPSDDANGSDTE